MTLRTKRNLDIAMHGEAFAAAKYKRFAALARTRGIADHAELLSDLADESRIGHFADEFRLAGLLSMMPKICKTPCETSFTMLSGIDSLPKKLNRMATNAPPHSLKC